MGRHFTQLKWDERIRIEEKLLAGKSIGQIAKELGRSYSTVWRETHRGSYMHRNTDLTETKRYSPTSRSSAPIITARERGGV